MEKSYKQAAIQICGECQGEGVIWQLTRPARHGSDYETGTLARCAICAGTGRVKVVKDITVTITPHIQAPESGFTELKDLQDG